MFLSKSGSGVFPGSKTGVPEFAGNSTEATTSWVLDADSMRFIVDV
jgi:hypothetical protein